MTQAGRIVLSLLLVLTPIVYRLGVVSPALAQAGKQKSQSTNNRQRPPSALPRFHYGIEDLPEPVQEMREADPGRGQSGRIEDFRTP